MNASPSRAEEIFGAALDIPDPEQRRSYIERACAGDAELREEVESLLAAHAQGSTFLEHPAAALGGSLVETSEDPGEIQEVVALSEKPGDRIGRYKLLEQIGEGGFGVVWMAEQEEPVRRRVALKVIKLGMDTHQVVARFEAERQALALMDHPNIARVIDGGATETGRPYFVMELVRGIPITEYCDAQKLTTVERLELFMQVCQAVQHAHQKGVIHRDLKPSNILVTELDGKAVPKVIDFGVAKATQTRLTEKTVFTRFHQLIGTPAYMSPEQAGLGGLDIDTRSDIYSLGVVLYELLTGRTPFDAQKLLAAGYDAILRVVREEEPQKPSTRLSTLTAEELSAVASRRKAEPARLNRLVRGDLDWIVMKALEKDRKRRYDAANGLARDLERYLRSEPVSAAAPSALYRLHKFARRNRAALASVSIIALLLVAGVVASTLEAVRARRAERVQHDLRQQADHERQRAVVSEKATREKDALIRKNAAQADFLTACDKLDSGQPALALAYLSRALRLDPSNAAARARTATLVAQRPWPRLLARIPGGPASFSPDGRWIVGPSGEKSVRVWGSTTGKPISEAMLHTNAAVWASFSPDSRLVLTACWVTNGLGAEQVREEASGKALRLLEHRRAVGVVQVWEAATGRPLSGPIKHVGPFCPAMFSADSRWVVTASEDQTARVWEAATGSLVSESMKHEDRVNSASFSPDGRWVVTASEDKTARVWDAATGKAVSIPMIHDHGVNSALFSPDGRWVVTTSEGKIARVWAAATGQPVSEPMKHERAVKAATFSRDVRFVLTVGEPANLAALLFGGQLGDGPAQVWEAATGKPLSEPMRPELGPSSADFSPDGLWVLTKATMSAQVFEAATGKPLSEPMTHDEMVSSARFSSDGCWVATASGDYTARLWDAASGLPVSEPLRHEQPVWDATFSPDNRRLVTWAAEHEDWGDLQASESLVWELPVHRANCSLLKHEAAVSSASFSPDGRWVVTASGALGSHAGEARVWEAATGKPLSAPMKHHGEVSSARFSPDGRWVVTASSDNTARVWEAATSKPVSEPLQHSNVVYSATFSPDGRWVLTASGDATARLWRAATGEPRSELMKHEGPVNFATFSPDGYWVATASTDTVRLWEAATGKPIFEPVRLHHSANSITFSPDGRWLAIASGDQGWHAGEARVWDAATSKPISESMRHQDRVTSVTFSPDGRWVATASEDKTARVWEAATGRPVSEPMKHQMEVIWANFSPDGRWVVTSCGDGTVRVWDAATGKPVSEPMKHENQVRSAMFSPDGRLVVTASDDKTARVWPWASIPAGNDQESSALLQQLAEYLGGIAFSENEAVPRQIPATVLIAKRQALQQVQNHPIYGQLVRWVFNPRAEIGKLQVASMETPSDLANLGTVSPEAERRVQSIEFCGEVGVSYARKLNWNHPTMLRASQNVVGACLRAGKFAQAIEMLEPLRESEIKDLGSNHPETLVTMDNLSLAYHAAGRLAEAIPLYEQVRDSKVKSLGANHPDALTTINNLATAYREAGKLSEAIGLFEQVRATNAEKLGADHPATLVTTYNLARTCQAAGKSEQALTLFRQAVEGIERGSFQHEQTDSIIGDFVGYLEQLQQYAEAESWDRKWQSAVKEHNGSGSAAYAAALASRGSRLLSQRKWTEAEPLLCQCAAIREKVLPGDWRTFDVGSLLGASLLGQQKYAEAEPLLLSGYEGMKQWENALGKAKPRLREALARVVQFYEATGRSAQAGEWKKKLETFDNAEADQEPAASPKVEPK